MTASIDYSVEPRSRADLRELAFQFREMFHLNDQLYIPIVELLDALEVTDKGFSYSIIPDDTLPEYKHADTNVYTGEIRIKEHVYDGARALCLLGFKLCRTIGGGKPKPYEDPEWQAKCLAGELLIPYDLTAGMSASKIAQECGVSFEAAQYRLRF